jgi:hypothetical protein
VKSYYLILDKNKKYHYGAFPKTKEGKILADKYLKKLKRLHKLDFFIK